MAVAGGGTAILSALAEEQYGLAAGSQKPVCTRHAGRDNWSGELHGKPVVFPSTARPAFPALLLQASQIAVARSQPIISGDRFVNSAAEVERLLAALQASGHQPLGWRWKARPLPRSAPTTECPLSQCEPSPTAQTTRRMWTSRVLSQMLPAFMPALSWMNS